MTATKMLIFKSRDIMNREANPQSTMYEMEPLTTEPPEQFLILHHYLEVSSILCKKFYSFQRNTLKFLISF